MTPRTNNARPTSARNEEIVRLYVVEKRTLADIGRRVGGISVERVRQILRDRGVPIRAYTIREAALRELVADAREILRRFALASRVSADVTDWLERASSQLREAPAGREVPRHALTRRIAELEEEAKFLRQIAALVRFHAQPTPGSRTYLVRAFTITADERDSLLRLARRDPA